MKKTNLEQNFAEGWVQWNITKGQRKFSNILILLCFISFILTRYLLHMPALIYVEINLNGYSKLLSLLRNKAANSQSM